MPILLALAASVAYGLSDFLGGRSSRRVRLLSVLAVSQGAALLLLAAFVVWEGNGPPECSFVRAALLAGLCEVVAVAALYRGFAVGLMSVVAPVAAAAPVVPLLAGLALGDVPAPLQSVGSVLIVVGVVMVSLGARESKRWGQEKAGSSLVFGLLAALGFGSFYVAMDAASAGSVPWALLIARLTSLPLVLLALLVRREGVFVPRSLLAQVVAVGGLIVVADSLYAFATTLGLLGVVAVLSSLHALVTILLARIFLGEKLARAQQVGVALCLVGVAAVAGR